MAKRQVDTSGVLKIRCDSLPYREAVKVAQIAKTK
jgi:hypothetical protein